MEVVVIIAVYLLILIFLLMLLNIDNVGVLLMCIVWYADCL